MGRQRREDTITEGWEKSREMGCTSRSIIRRKKANVKVYHEDSTLTTVRG